jgi:predicted acylesterase/phospholipase RssA
VALDALRTARRQLLPLPLVDRPQRLDASVFERYDRRPVAALRDKRVGLVGSRAGGSAVALVGVKRAFEEAGVEVESISTCSGSTIWGAMWAAGLDAEAMAGLALSWRPERYLGIQWTGLPRFALSALRGFTGLEKEEALEQLFERRVWHMSAGETEVALHTPAYELSRAEVEWFGSEETPELTLGELVQIAVARPAPSEAVRIEGELYVDGGVVDSFPAEPMIADGGFDRVFALKMAPPRSRNASRAELARRSRSRLGESLTLIEPIPRDESHGFAFYDLFLDRARWPDLMRRGYESTREALAPFRRRRRS